MRVVVTGSSGHLGEALVRVLRADGEDVVGLDVAASPWTDVVGSVTDRRVVTRALDGADAVIHAATLHKPHLGTHTRSQFVEVNVTGTVVVLEEAARARVGRAVLTSTTSAFGRALAPTPGEPAAWITEDVAPLPRNIYGVTKVAAEDVAELVRRDHGLPVVVLRTSRFFPEPDDDPGRRVLDPANLQALELAHRRVDLADVVSAHRAALDRAPALGFARYIISATTPFTPEDRMLLRSDPVGALDGRLRGAAAALAELGWRAPGDIDRVYVNDRARAELGWAPRHDVASALAAARAGAPITSDLARQVGAKGYHPTSVGVYTRR